MGNGGGPVDNSHGIHDMGHQIGKRRDLRVQHFYLDLVKKPHRDHHRLSVGHKACPWATQNKPRQESTVEWSNLAAEDQAPTAGPQRHDTRPTCPEEGTANVLEHSGVAGKHKDDDPVCGRRSNRVQTGNLMCTSPPSPIELTVVTGMLAGAEHLYSASLLWSTKPPHWIV